MRMAVEVGTWRVGGGRSGKGAMKEEEEGIYRTKIEERTIADLEEKSE